MGGPEAHGYADLVISPGAGAWTVVELAEVGRVGDRAWAVKVNAHRRQRFGVVYHRAPTRGRAMAWASRWASVHRVRLLGELVPGGWLGVG